MVFPFLDTHGPLPPRTMLIHMKASYPENNNNNNNIVIGGGWFCN